METTNENGGAREIREILRRGVTSQLAGDLDEARLRYQHALELDPEDDHAANNLAFLHMQQGRHAEAVAIYERVLARSPQRARKTSAGRSAIRLAANESQRWPPIAFRLSSTAAPRMAAGMPIHGNIRPSARSFAVSPARSRQSLGTTATATAR